MSRRKDKQNKKKKSKVNFKFQYISLLLHVMLLSYAVTY